MDAESIVRALAQREPPIHQEWGDCMLCGADSRTFDDLYVWRDPAAHKLDCPWRLARAWVDYRTVDVGTLDGSDQRIPAPGYAIIDGDLVEVLDERYALLAHDDAPPSDEET